MTSVATPTMSVTNLADPVMYYNPYPRYAYLRENEPVSRVKAPMMVRGTGFMVTRHADVVNLHTDERFSTDSMRYGGAARFNWMLPQTLKLLGETMVFKDDPEHKRLRTLVHKAFTPKMIAGLSDQVTSIATELADGLERKKDVDLVNDFAVELPLRVISSMLGVNDADRAEFHQLVNRMTEDSGGGPIGMIRRMPVANKLLKFIQHLADEARANPADNVITAIVEAREDGDRLTDREVLGMIFLLLLAGHDTTSNMIGSSMLALVHNPDQLTALRDDEALWPTAIEELLRYTTPVACAAPRIAIKDLEFAGAHIPRGSQVVGMIISANRDKEIYDDPESLDLTRSPNKHMSFAFGAHYCLGHHLARLEARVALRTLLDRFSTLEVTVPDTDLRYKATLSLRGLKSLPMRVGV
ncbi:cytochrome P450 [Gordonia jinghuaiqii]|uniref:Cytochrome P450 n=1 Tax=Gordonia jinghuaiqii TaxID=2758710 RepID=A0A7D7LQW3_9ACTN|nr:cytochrome P450 [Gordonia jinghuaiqii]MCR5979299.1 cytochrome P450 [Gordonia jinghuaiqii]QMT01085.1 cytochrome P450 [Gordonia jinghuaiqii]